MSTDAFFEYTGGDIVGGQDVLRGLGQHISFLREVGLDGGLVGSRVGEEREASLGTGSAERLLGVKYQVSPGQSFDGVDEVGETGGLQEAVFVF